MKKIAVISHDAGASEILVAYIKAHQNQAKWFLCALPGSAFEKIAQREGLSTQPDLDLFGFDALFFGTGWKEHPERAYLKEAKQLGIPSFAFLDHWSSYRERFDYPNDQWRKNLPAFVVTSDKKAEKIAKEFALSEVLRVNNFYQENELSNLRNERVAEGNNLLFLSEPTKEVALASHGDANYWGFDQYSALEDILTHFEHFNTQGLSIRLHPSEADNTYKNVLKKFPHIRSEVYPAGFYPLAKDLMRAKMIIGFDTVALYTAALLEKPVISYLPSDNRDFCLPLPPSHQLRALTQIKPQHFKTLGMKLDDDGIQFAQIEQKIEEFFPC